jgi:hypothetical protein
MSGRRSDWCGSRGSPHDAQRGTAEERDGGSRPVTLILSASAFRSPSRKPMLKKPLIICAALVSIAVMACLGAEVRKGFGDT